MSKDDDQAGPGSALRDMPFVSFFEAGFDL
jgi:hypothetical protein